jgi:hypothetical protein
VVCEPFLLAEALHKKGLEKFINLYFHRDDDTGSTRWMFISRQVRVLFPYDSGVVLVCGNRRFGWGTYYRRECKTNEHIDDSLNYSTR